MGSCVSKKAARAGAGARDGNNNVTAPLPAVKEMNNHALSPVAEEEEEVKEVVLSETPIRLPMPPPESPPMKKKMRPQQVSEEQESGSGSESASVAKEKTMMAKESKEEEEVVVKRAVVDSPEKALRTRRRAARSPSPARAPEEESNKPKQNKQVAGAGNNKNGRARSPSPSRKQQPAPPPTRPRREQPAVVSAFGCRSGRFSPSAARRAAEGAAVRRSHSARDGDMAMSAKRSLAATINGHGNNNAAAALSRRDPGERSGRRANSPTASRRPSPAPSPVHHRQARRAAARENNSLSGSTPERSRPRVRDPGGGDEQPAFVPGRGGGGEQKNPEQGALGQNPSVAMECFIFL